MPVLLENPSSAPLPPHKKWTREECAELEKTGLLDWDRYELIEGELLLKMSKNHPHMVIVAVLAAWLREVFGTFLVITEPSIDLRPEDKATNAPEPDVIVLSQSIRELHARPLPDQLLLVAEVSDSTLAFDRTTKARLYARSAIREYWVLDVQGRRVIVHREPAGGEYRSIEAYGEDERVATLASPAHEIRVGELLG
jgi:Uma2 family endonuclease